MDFTKEIIMHASFHSTARDAHACYKTEYSLEHLWNEENAKELGIRAAGKDHKIITRISEISSGNKSPSSQKCTSTKTTIIFNI